MPSKSPDIILRIMNMLVAGWTYSQISRHFGISRSRVGQIAKREKQRKASTERSQQLCQQIRADNDIDKKLAIDDLLCVLNLPKRAETILRVYFNRQSITVFSLWDMMDFLIPAVENPQDHYELMPAYKVKMLGQILYAAMIKGLSAIDCGKTFSGEWAARKRRLRDCLASTGGFYPYILNGKGAALLDY